MKESFEELKRPIQRLKGFFESLWLHVEPSPCAGLLSELGRWFPLWHNHKAIRKMETSVLSPQPDWPLYPDYPTGTMPTRPVPEKQGNMGRSCVLSALCMNRRLWFSLEFGPTVKCQWHCKTLRHFESLGFVTLLFQTREMVDLVRWTSLDIFCFSEKA